MAKTYGADAYNPAARFFHWAAALIVLGLLALGLYMTRLEPSTHTLGLYGVHKSFGFLLLGLVLARLAWRFLRPPPGHLPTHKPWERRLAGFIHVCLYLALIGMPLSGWVMSSAMDFPHSFFGLFSMPDIIPGHDEALFMAARTAHTYCAYALMAAIGLHAAGAFKHHIIDRDRTLIRMLPPRPARYFAALMMAAIALTGLYYMPRPGGNEVTRLTNPGGVEQPPGPAEITAPRWMILPEDSRVEFTATVQGTDFTARVADMEGTIAFAVDDLRGSYAKVSVGLPTVTSGSAERDESMLSPLWFDVASFPRAVFESIDIVPHDAEGPNHYVARGNLTLRDVTERVIVFFKLTKSTDNDGNIIANMEGRFTVNRLDFGIGQGEWQNTNTVAAPVSVRVFVMARRETP